jgi:hypothetical protein
MSRAVRRPGACSGESPRHGRSCPPHARRGCRALACASRRLQPRPTPPPRSHAPCHRPTRYHLAALLLPIDSQGTARARRPQRRRQRTGKGAPSPGPSQHRTGESDCERHQRQAADSAELRDAARSEKRVRDRRPTAVGREEVERRIADHVEGREDQGRRKTALRSGNQPVRDVRHTVRQPARRGGGEVQPATQGNDTPPDHPRRHRKADGPRAGASPWRVALKEPQQERNTKARSRTQR